MGEGKKKKIPLQGYKTYLSPKVRNKVHGNHSCQLKEHEAFLNAQISHLIQLK